MIGRKWITYGIYAPIYLVKQIHSPREKMISKLLGKRYKKCKEMEKKKNKKGRNSNIEICIMAIFNIYYTICTWMH